MNTPIALIDFYREVVSFLRLHHKWSVMIQKWTVLNVTHAHHHMFTIVVMNLLQLIEKKQIFEHDCFFVCSTTGAFLMLMHKIIRILHKQLWYIKWSVMIQKWTVLNVTHAIAHMNCDRPLNINCVHGSWIFGCHSSHLISSLRTSSLTYLI